MLELRPDHDFCQLKDADTKYRRGFFAGTLFYPGQTLVGPLSGLENATWLTARPEMRNTRRSTTVSTYILYKCAKMLRITSLRLGST